MIAICKLCKEIVVGREVVGPVAMDENGRVVRQVQEFDLLAASMVNHILSAHQQMNGTPAAPPAMELSAVANLAGKVYAMNHAVSSGSANFEALRESWKTTIRNFLFPQAEAAAAPGASSDSAALPSGS